MNKPEYERYAPSWEFSKEMLEGLLKAVCQPNLFLLRLEEKRRQIKYLRLMNQLHGVNKDVYRNT